MKFNIIACVNYNRAIGWKQNNNLIFHIPKELALFKKITMQGDANNDKMNIIVMGRRTWDSIPGPKPLPGRFNCVISSNHEVLNKNYKDKANFKAFHNVDCFLNFADNNQTHFNETFVIGGKSIYEDFFRRQIVNKLFLTEIETVNYFGDVAFPVGFLVGYYLKNCEQYKDIQAINILDNIKITLDYSVRVYEKYERIDYKNYI